MKPWAFVITVTFAAAALAAGAADRKETAMTLHGKTLRWTFTGGTLPAASYEHTLRDDGTIAWRVVDGPAKGKSAEEKRHAAVKIADGIFAVSYLAASGYTLTVVVNVHDRRVTGFASNDREWYPLTGTLDAIE